MKQSISTVFLFILLVQPIFSQEVVSNSGGESAQSGLDISFTIGEPLIDALSGSQHSIFQGYQQPDVEISSFIRETDSKHQILVFPNPTSELLSIKGNPNFISYIQCSLYDISGNLLRQRSDKHSIQFDVSKLASAIYVLRISINAEYDLTYKIYKQ